MLSAHTMPHSLRPPRIMETRRAAGLNFAPDKAYPHAAKSFCALSATIESRSEIDLQSVTAVHMQQNGLLVRIYWEWERGVNFAELF